MFAIETVEIAGLPEKVSSVLHKPRRRGALPMATHEVAKCALPWATRRQFQRQEITEGKWRFMLNLEALLVPPLTNEELVQLSVTTSGNALRR